MGTLPTSSLTLEEDFPTTILIDNLFLGQRIVLGLSNLNPVRYWSGGGHLNHRGHLSHSIMIYLCKPLLAVMQH
jgi:hypothetical protein